MNLIDRDKLIDDIEHRLWDWETVDGIVASTVLKQTVSDIRNMLTIEAEPVRHAKWWRYPLQQAGFPNHVYMMRQCSECKKVFDQKWNYCPNCGAKMDGGK